jgi:hypothetical protein
LPTITFSGVAVEDEIPAPVGTAFAVSVTAPLVDGRHVQVTEKLDPEPLAVLLLQPGIITFLALKVTFAATLTFAVIVTNVLNEGVPLTENELNEDVSTTSVTVIVIV